MSEDRTSEFFSVASTLSPSDGFISSTGNYPSSRINSSGTNNSTGAHRDRSSRSGGAGAGGAGSVTNAMTPMKSAAYSELRTFHTTASQISMDIAQTSALLTELTKLVRTRTLFMDDSERVNFLVLKIKSNIENLNLRLEESQKVINAQKRRLGEKSQAGQEASNIVGQLKEDFVKATTGFKTVLQQRSDWMKEQSERKRDVFGGNAQGDNLSFMGTKPQVYGGGFNSDTSAISNSKLKNNNMNMLDLTSGLMKDVGSEHYQQTGESSSSLPRPGGLSSPPSFGLRQRAKSGDLSFGSGLYSPLDMSTPNDEPKTALTPLEMQRLDEESGNAQMMQLIPDQTYLRERADAMSTVESNIVELGTIFNKLAVMVSEHREVVQRLEDNVSDASRNINLSMETLTDTLASLSTNRALFGKVVGVLVLFIILFITFFA